MVESGARESNRQVITDSDPSRNLVPFAAQRVIAGAPQWPAGDSVPDAHIGTRMQADFLSQLTAVTSGVRIPS